MALEEAYQEVERQFEIDLLPEQKQSIKAFFEEKNVFVNLPTGYGKSLIFQCLPIVSDIVNEKPRASSLMLVISPLTALMKDQTDRLNNLGIPAISLVDVDDPDIIQQVIDGFFCEKLVR
ncbi:uncharacterized protein LOC110239870 [Exaiptasia diaphana]|uniref:DEAD/DEAH-box helicase domain-containing protein n=1 Tax=Exaiptasia diaphana TaxID=2652724 RepID=A0A913XA25_EXADI|nr:uncharacterized protein LOC110239870 [Exaiptasia diaphana]